MTTIRSIVAGDLDEQGHTLATHIAKVVCMVIPCDLLRRVKHANKLIIYSFSFVLYRIEAITTETYEENFGTAYETYML